MSKFAPADAAMRRSPQTRLIGEVCGEPIGTGAGYASVDQDQVAERARAFRAFRESYPGTDMRGYTAAPPPVKWELVHAVCDPAPDSHWYRIPAEHLTSERQILYRTMLLAQRMPWFIHTSIKPLVRRMLDDHE